MPKKKPKRKRETSYYKVRLHRSDFVRSGYYTFTSAEIKRARKRAKQGKGK